MHISQTCNNNLLWFPQQLQPDRAAHCQHPAHPKYSISEQQAEPLPWQQGDTPCQHSTYGYPSNCPHPDAYCHCNAYHTD